MPRDRIAESTHGWQRLTTALFANAADLLHLAERRERLAVLLDRIEELGNQQAALAASKQEVTQRFQAALAEARTVAAFLRSGVREKYGKTAEKLVEFGIRPFRGLPRPPAPEEPAPEPEQPGPEAEGPPVEIAADTA